MNGKNRNIDRGNAGCDRIAALLADAKAVVASYPPFVPAGNTVGKLLFRDCHCDLTRVSGRGRCI